MSWKFHKIEKDGEQIKGQPKNSSPITILDEGWIDTKNDSDPKWREISRLLIDAAFRSDEEIQNGDRVQIDIETAVKALSESDHVNHTDNDTEQERLMSRLLIEYLVSESIYDLNEDRLVILEDPTSNAGKTKTNLRGWYIFMKTAAENRESIINEIKKEKESLIKEMENMDIAGEIKEQYDNLVRDLSQISDEDFSESSVSSEDMTEYKKKMAKLEAVFPAVQNGNSGVEIEAVIGETISRLEGHASTFRSRATYYANGNIKAAVKELQDQNQVDSPIDMDPNMTGDDIRKLDTKEKSKLIWEQSSLSADEIETSANDVDSHSVSNQGQSISSDNNSVDEDFVE